MLLNIVKKSKKGPVKIFFGQSKIHVRYYTSWERTAHVSRCSALYSGRIFVPLCRELIIFVF